MGLIRITPADKWFSMCVRERAEWRCEFPGCGVHYPPPTAALHCCHVFSRGNWSTRFDPFNAVAGCYGHHRYSERMREDYFIPFVKKLIGEHEYDRLCYDKNRPANGIRKRVSEIAKHYKAEFERMQKLRDEGVTGRLTINPWEGI